MTAAFLASIWSILISSIYLADSRHSHQATHRSLTSLVCAMGAFIAWTMLAAIYEVILSDLPFKLCGALYTGGVCGEVSFLLNGLASASEQALICLCTS